MALGVGIITSQILGSALKGNQDTGTKRVASGGSIGGNFLNTILGQNDSEIPEAKTLEPVNNTGMYVGVILIIIAALVFIYFATIKKT